MSDPYEQVKTLMADLDECKSRLREAEEEIERRKRTFTFWALETGTPIAVSQEDIQEMHDENKRLEAECNRLREDMTRMIPELEYVVAWLESDESPDTVRENTAWDYATTALERARQALEQERGWFEEKFERYVECDQLQKENRLQKENERMRSRLLDDMYYKADDEYGWSLKPRRDQR